VKVQFSVRCEPKISHTAGMSHVSWRPEPAPVQPPRRRLSRSSAITANLAHFRMNAPVLTDTLPLPPTCGGGRVGLAAGRIMLSELCLANHQPRFPIRHNANRVAPLLGQIQPAWENGVLSFGHRNRSPQVGTKRWIRSQACCSDEVAVAYEIRKAGPTPKGVPCTTATPSDSKSSVTKSSSVLIRFPTGGLAHGPGARG